MLKRLIPWLSALIAFVAVGISVGSYEAEHSRRHARGMHALCYRDKGHSLGTGPQEVVAQCSEIMFRQTQETWFYFAGAGAGLVAAVIVLGIFAVIRRRKSSI